jgi:uncharacterized OsmC-like protein/esterase/lipase
MTSEKLEFKNADGKTLVGRLEIPASGLPHNFAIFAHCFTCSKNLRTVKNISRALTQKGFGVLRFDFTGLGESEGEFANTNFSGNMEDLLAAAAHLRSHYSAPSLLIGHSLGGTACLMAASSLKEVQAVATLGSPADPEHVSGLLKDDLETIRKNGKATVSIGGRPFTIKEQFLQDIANQPWKETIANLDKALLFMHSPQDKIVGIQNAERLYKAARHPKSFISLDGSDHLITRDADSIYAGLIIAEWSRRYISMPEKELVQTEEQVVARLESQAGFTTEMQLGKHALYADEPKDFGGQELGPSPYEFVSAGLASCTAMTLQMYARRKNWSLDEVQVHTSYDKKHAEDCEACEKPGAKIDTFKREILLKGSLDDSQRQRLLEIANKCPVHRTLESDIHIDTQLLE